MIDLFNVFVGEYGHDIQWSNNAFSLCW